nr:hypothetical protein [Tanacetum cinerariifolium]
MIRWKGVAWFRLLREGNEDGKDLESKIDDVMVTRSLQSGDGAACNSSGGVVNLTSDEDPTYEDGDIRMGDSTGVSASLGGKIFSGGKKFWESNIGDSDNTGDGGLERLSGQVLQLGGQEYLKEGDEDGKDLESKIDDVMVTRSLQGGDGASCNVWCGFKLV